VRLGRGGAEQGSFWAKERDDMETNRMSRRFLLIAVSVGPGGPARDPPPVAAPTAPDRLGSMDPTLARPNGKKVPCRVGRELESNTARGVAVAGQVAAVGPGCR
jgi:hypothetical protein